MQKSTANSFCKNCEHPLSEHKEMQWQPFNTEFFCPIGDGISFYTTMSYIQMTNLEFLERRAHSETLRR